MNDMMEASMRKLELPTVLRQLADSAVSEEAKARCLRLTPRADKDEVQALQDETEAARHLILVKSTPGFQEVKDVGPSLQRADRGGSLSPIELLRIAGVLRCARAIKEYGDGDEKSVLDGYFICLTANRYLEDRITNSILSEEEIADSASAELADIRRHMRAQSAKIRDSLQKIVSSPSYAKYLREPIVTLRSDRYVVPVKSEFKNEIPGLVHDVSASGGTFFVEPMSAVNANNALRELLTKEKREIERILAELSAEAADHLEQIETDYRMLVALDVVFAKAKFSLQMRAAMPLLREDGQLELRKARHPLIEREKVVPISIRLGSDFDTLIVTGPNTGGKTVSLKTLGLLTLMTECGLQIPVEDGSSVNLFRTVFADIGDEQSIEQSLSTFSAHMKNIVSVVEQCDDSSLVLFDELGAGTDPAEGAALAIALIEFCRGVGARVVATTHYAELKLYALRTDGVMNASCEFDVETLAPTYRLLIGVPGKSNAFAISRKLGLPEHIIESARNTVNENDQNFEDVLSQLEVQRQEMEKARGEAEQLRQETARMKEKSETYYEEIKQEREKAVQKARKEAQMILDEARRTANAAYDELKQMRKQLREGVDAQGFNERQSELRRGLNEAEDKLREKQTPKARPQPSRAPRVGDTVELIKLGTRATVLEVHKDGALQLQAGILKVTARPEEVYLLENEQQKQVKRYMEQSQRELRNVTGTPELDIRGMATDEAMPVLDQFLDNAVMSKLSSARIIHGKGTGVLRKAVHDHLKRSHYVKNFRLGVYGEGEDGVTIVEF
ncbi:MAG: endonuclease MutS2 [Oscillospiraceae bacterium]|nr:endonuclease MutS2 [Oscillospiraceae bacterium]